MEVVDEYLADLLGEADDDDEVELTPAQVIALMEEAWSNERFAPEVLPHKSEVVECLLGQISFMEDNVKQLSSSDFRKSLHQMEVDRLRFLVSSYLRTRLEKIETFVKCILQEERQRRERGEEAYLNEDETRFATGYSKSLNNYFSDVFRFDPSLPSENLENQLIKPNMNTFIFGKSKKKVEGVVINEGNPAGDNDLVDFDEDTQMLISYDSVANLVKNGDVKLI